MEKLLSVLKSRKFWAALVGVVMVFMVELIPSFPLDTQQVSDIVYLIVAYILGVSVEDGLRAARS
jgi:uncharacterized membrane protein